MNDDLKDILSHLNPDIDQETLLRYLQGHLSSEEQHEVEKQMQESDFEADALEGLQDFKDKEKIRHVVDQLKKDLHNKTQKQKVSRKKRPIFIDPWLIFAIIMILALIVVSYFLIRLYVRH